MDLFIFGRLRFSKVVLVVFRGLDSNVVQYIIGKSTKRLFVKLHRCSHRSSSWRSQTYLHKGSYFDEMPIAGGGGGGLDICKQA